MRSISSVGVSFLFKSKPFLINSLVICFTTNSKTRVSVLLVIKTNLYFPGNSLKKKVCGSCHSLWDVDGTIPVSLVVVFQRMLFLYTFISSGIVPFPPIP